MNSSSTIEISQSSLLSLKAEILRKQQEISKAKKCQAHLETQTRLREKSRGNKEFEGNETQNKQIIEQSIKDEEEIQLLQKSKKMLEFKADLYNRLVKGPESLSEFEIEMNKHYLVQFDRKEKAVSEDNSGDEDCCDEYESTDNPEDEWVEYTDCLGRTRKCLRKDLELMKVKDLELCNSLGPDIKNKSDTKECLHENKEKIIDEDIEKTNNESSATISESSELLSNDMRKELLRLEWEKQEQELLNKKDVHYQDILFNEARTHGVGYYAFSKDDKERSKQQEELQKLRQETIKKQTASVEQKATREKQLAARLKAARNRKRARMGLPPEEDEPEVPAASTKESTKPEELKETSTEKEREEKEKEEARRKHIRAWDIGKEGIVPHYEYSQEEWNEKKRAERSKEFAPPSFYGHQIQTNEDENTKQNNTLFFTTKKLKPMSRKIKNINPYKKNSDLNYKNSDQDTTSLVNDCVDFDDEQLIDTKKQNANLTYGNRPRSTKNINAFERQSDSAEDQNYKSSSISEQSIFADDYIDSDDEKYEMKSKRKGVEIAPPTTFDYYGPTTSKYQKLTTKQNLEESITAGLKYLREKSELKQKHSNREFDNT